MPIQPTVLHPENNPDVDLHPETDAGQVTDFLNKTYPVNSIFMSVDSTSPASLFGGTWTRIQNGFLLSAGYNNIASGATGGNKDAIIPYHTHEYTENGSHIVGFESNHLFQRNNAGTPCSGWGITATFYSNENGSFLNVKRDGIEYAGSAGNITNANMPPYIAVYMWKRVA